MKPDGLGAAARGLLPEARTLGPMPWVIAIMMFLTLLAAAAGLGLAGAASRLGDAAGQRVTIQIVEADPATREAQARAALAALRPLPGILSVRRIESAEIQELLAPWLGTSAVDAEIPLPAMIDVDLAPAARADLGSLRAAVTAAAPAARIDDSAATLAPLANLIESLRWLAFALVALMLVATGAIVALAARAALDTHRETIEVLHLMGGTDAQVARLFQRRIALDTLFGGLVGLAAAMLVMIAIGNRVSALGSDLLGGAALPLLSWLILMLLPLAGTALAMAVARATILRALRRLL